MQTAFERRCLSIGGVTLGLGSEHADLKLRFGRAAEDFLVDEAETDRADIRLTVAWRQLEAEPRGEKLFDSGALWTLYRENGSHVFRFVSKALGEAPYRVARLNSDFTAGQVFLDRRFFQPHRPLDPLEYPLDELLIIHFLARGAGLEVHACGVADEGGKGFLFAGQSGAGKTTTARLWEKQAGVTILSDDRIILRKAEGRIWMYGTPWHGEARLASPARAPLTGLYFLRQANANELLPLPTIEAAAQLLAMSFLPFHSREGLASTLEFCEEILKETPCYDFRFTPDERAVEFVRARS
ncbi:MAG: hypothetical protein ACRD1B_11930 [Thermoanaerobaculia bacterium]